MTHRLFLVLSIAVSLSVPALAQVAPALPSPAGPPKSSSVSLVGGLPSVEKVTKDMKKATGFFTIYYRDSKASSSGKDPEQLLALIPSSLLNQDLLLATSVSRGGSFTGWMWDDYLIRFEKRGKLLALIVPDVRYPAGKGNPLSDVIARTYNPTILATARILSLGGGGILVDLGPLLKSNLARLPVSGSVRSDLSKWIRRAGFPKVFQNNVLIDVELAVGSSRGTSLMGVTYGFRKLPAKGSYTPRHADDRIGYFLTAQRDWTKKHNERDIFNLYINRWDLKKKDATLELSPPVKPITFYIEKTVPIQWRRWVRQGIEVWNKAFEKIGFTDAIVVLQQTSDNDYKDIDPEDARYNFFRWLVSGQPFAMGPSRTDPRTGQILDSDIVFDDSMIRSWINSVSTFTPHNVAELKGPGFRRFLSRHPNLRIPGANGPDSDLGKSVVFEEVRKIAEEKLIARGQNFCEFSFGFQHQIALGYYAMAAHSGSAKIPERLIGEAIRETVAHEVGHALGLRHNFKGSSWLSLDEVKRRRSTDEPTSGSVMDYNPILFLPGDHLESMAHFVTPTIGPYDYWAIEYGYRIPGPKDKGEKVMLTAIASRCASPGLAYATDEDNMWVYSPDPLVGSYDMGSDSLVWAEARIQLVDSLIQNVTEFSAEKGESHYHVTRAFETLLREKGTILDKVVGWVGGQYFHRDHKGDPDARPPFVLVSAQKQRDALDLLKKTILNESFFEFSPELLNQLAPPRWSHWGASLMLRVDYPIHDRIRMLQWWTLIDLLSPPLLQRVYDGEVKSSEPDKFTVSELLSTIQDHIWAPLDRLALSRAEEDAQFSDSNPCFSSILRGLQREHLEIVLESVLSRADGGVSPDLHALICGHARDLLEKLDQDITHLDRASRAHLEECRSRLGRALEAQYQRQG